MMKTEKKQTRENLKSDFKLYLSCQRGLSEKTIYDYSAFVDRFLNFKFGDESDDLSSITSRDITDFLQHFASRIPSYRDRTTTSFLRSFLRFLFQKEIIKTNLALGVPSVKLNCSRRIPYHLTLDQVEELLAAVRTLPSFKSKKRNYAMVLLMARLGLRSPEVIAIHLEDIDWRKGEIIIRGKGGYHDKVPLLEDIGEAISVYIKNERKGIDRHLFLGYHPPHMPFIDAQVLNSILKKALEITTIPRPKQYTISNILRHSLASNLVRQGASLEEVSNTLRHRSRSTTLKYARLDVNGLRTIALPWPMQKGGQS